LFVSNQGAERSSDTNLKLNATLPLTLNQDPSFVNMTTVSRHSKEVMLLKIIFAVPIPKKLHLLVLSLNVV